MRPRAFALATAALALGLMTGCGAKPLSGPPELRLGRDECAECGMLINEDRCSSALLVERDGRREYLLFDDLGCMLDVEREQLEGRKIVERYAHDHTTKQWCRAEQAVFLLADPDKLATPMGSGMVAFKSREAAESARTAHGGELTDYAGVVKARQAWSDEYHKPTSRPGDG